MKKKSKVLTLCLFLVLLFVVSFSITAKNQISAQTNNLTIEEPRNLIQQGWFIINYFVSNLSFPPSENTDVEVPPDIHTSDQTGSIPDPNQPQPNVTIGPIPPPNASKLTKILYWTSILNNKLIANNQVWPPWWYYHKMVNPISNGGYRGIAGNATDLSNLYWCTFLVIDAYNLSGIRGLTTAHSAVLNMIPFFMNTSGYTFIPYSVAFSSYSPPRYRVTNNGERRYALTKVQPGCTTFFQSNPGVHEKNHVAILKTKVLDANFNGFIETYDSNNTSRTVRYPVKDGNIMNTLYIPDSLRGFGCPI